MKLERKDGLALSELSSSMVLSLREGLVITGLERSGGHRLTVQGPTTSPDGEDCGFPAKYRRCHGRF